MAQNINSYNKASFTSYWFTSFLRTAFILGDKQINKYCIKLLQKHTNHTHRTACTVPSCHSVPHCTMHTQTQIVVTRWWTCDMHEYTFQTYYFLSHVLFWRAERKTYKRPFWSPVLEYSCSNCSSELNHCVCVKLWCTFFDTLKELKYIFIKLQIALIVRQFYFYGYCPKNLLNLSNL